MIFVTGVEHVSGYRLRLQFNDGSVRIVDLEKHLHGEMFEPLRTPSLFATAHLNRDIDTVVWDNGADMAPEFLYETGLPDTSGTELRVAEGREVYDCVKGNKSGKKSHV
jgi:hypothetical protein